MSSDKVKRQKKLNHPDNGLEIDPQTSQAFSFMVPWNYITEPIPEPDNICQLD